MHLIWRMILRTSKPPLLMQTFSTQINVRHFELLENATESTILSSYKILLENHCKRDLGVWTSSTLSWSKKVLHQCAQANKSLGYIRRPTIKIKIISVRQTLYLTFVCSHLAYASQVWAPQLVDLIKQNVFKDMSQSIHWTYHSSVTSATTIVSQH